MITAMRLLAQFIDIVLYFIILIFLLLIGLPFFKEAITDEFTLALIVFVLSIAIYFIMQYPFYTNLQTIGKAFFGLYILPKGHGNISNFVFVFIREIFIKLMTIYLVCLPVLFNKKGFHETAMNSEIILKTKRGK